MMDVLLILISGFKAGISHAISA